LAKQAAAGGKMMAEFHQRICSSVLNCTLQDKLNEPIKSFGAFWGLEGPVGVRFYGNKMNRA